MWGPWMGPMWGFWWIFPLIGLLFCAFFVFAMIRMMSGGRFMCMGSHRDNGEEVARLRREVEDLREQQNRQAVTRSTPSQHGKGNAA
jgi:hypothetical protein